MTFSGTGYSNRPSGEESAIYRYTYDFESRTCDHSKNAAASPIRSNMYNLTTKQRAPRSQKRAGAETTLRTSWTERPILHQFCFDNPPAGEGSKQVPEAAVVRDEWSRSLLTIRLLGREPKRWLVKGGLCCRRGFRRWEASHRRLLLCASPRMGDTT